MDLNQIGQEETIVRAKKYAAAARYAQRRGQHRRAALLYMVAATLLDPTGPQTSPLAVRARQRDTGKSDT
jgi:hypothetical protein